MAGLFQGHPDSFNAHGRLRRLDGGGTEDRAHPRALSHGAHDRAGKAPSARYDARAHQRRERRRGGASPHGGLLLPLRPRHRFFRRAHDGGQHQDLRRHRHQRDDRRLHRPCVRHRGRDGELRGTIRLHEGHPVLRHAARPARILHAARHALPVVLALEEELVMVVAYTPDSCDSIIVHMPSRFNESRPISLRLFGLISWTFIIKIDEYKHTLFSRKSCPSLYNPL